MLLFFKLSSEEVSYSYTRCAKSAKNTLPRRHFLLECRNAEMPKCRNAHTWPTDVDRVSLPTNQLDFDLIGLSKPFRLHFRPSTHFHHSRPLRFFHLTMELRYTRYFINYVSYELRRVSYGYRRSSRITRRSYECNLEATRVRHDPTDNLVRVILRVFNPHSRTLTKLQQRVVRVGLSGRRHRTTKMKRKLACLFHGKRTKRQVESDG